MKRLQSLRSVKVKLDAVSREDVVPGYGRRGQDSKVLLLLDGQDLVYGCHDEQFTDHRLHTMPASNVIADFVL